MEKRWRKVEGGLDFRVGEERRMERKMKRRKIKIMS